MTILVLGIGMQGKTALFDLLRSDGIEHVIAADLDIDSLQAHIAEMGYGQNVRAEFVDAADAGSIDRLMSQHPDVAIDLLPVPYIETVARSAIQHGVHLVNTFYVPDGLRALGKNAAQKGVTILPEFGMDPGIDLVLLGEAVSDLGSILEIKSYGGGIPELDAADNPIRYKVSWTLLGVLQSYFHPARIVRRGQVTEIGPAALFHPENVHEIEVSGLGRLEAIANGDALQYISVAGAKETTVQEVGRYSLRWPGHSKFWRTLVDLHLLDDDPIHVGGAPVDRKEYLEAVLSPHLQYGKGERDLGILVVEVRGERDGSGCRKVYEVVDRRDLVTGFSAMSRMVGFTTSIGAQMIGSGLISKRGLLSPVTDVPAIPFQEELAHRGIDVRKTVEC